MLVSLLLGEAQLKNQYFIMKFRFSQWICTEMSRRKTNLILSMTLVNEHNVLTGAFPDALRLKWHKRVIITSGLRNKTARQTTETVSVTATGCTKFLFQPIFARNDVSQQFVLSKYCIPSRHPKLITRSQSAGQHAALLKMESGSAMKIGKHIFDRVAAITSLRLSAKTNFTQTKL